MRWLRRWLEGGRPGTWYKTRPVLEGVISEHAPKYTLELCGGTQAK